MGKWLMVQSLGFASLEMLGGGMMAFCLVLNLLDN